MEIFVVGLNHKTAPLELREKLTVPPPKTKEALEDLGSKKVFDERILLSTCNRTEIYGAAADESDSIRSAKEFFGRLSGMPLDRFEDRLYVLRQPDSVEHLFSVASGLDSMVLGETEIIGQVKDAYFAAQKNGHTGKALNALFQRSFKVAKNLRSETEIGLGKVGVASLAVDLAEKIFGDLARARVMVLGTGEMSTQVAKAMISKGARSTIVSSRHPERAQTLARELGGEAVSCEAYEKRMADADVLIASTHAPHALVLEPQVRSWMKARHEKPLFIIDLAVPRNIDALVEKLDNVYLYNLDDLKTLAEENIAHRESQLAECFRRVRVQRQHFMDWLLKEFGPKGAL